MCLNLLWLQPMSICPAPELWPCVARDERVGASLCFQLCTSRASACTLPPHPSESPLQAGFPLPLPKTSPDRVPVASPFSSVALSSGESSWTWPGLSPYSSAAPLGTRLLVLRVPSPLTQPHTGPLMPSTRAGPPQDSGLAHSFPGSLRPPGQLVSREPVDSTGLSSQHLPLPSRPAPDGPPHTPSMFLQHEQTQPSSSSRSAPVCPPHLS